MVIQPRRQFCVPLEGKSRNGHTRIYNVYNTLDCPIMIGRTYGKDFQDDRPINLEPIQNCITKHEDDTYEVHPDADEKLDRLKDLVRVARALRALEHGVPSLAINQSVHKYPNSHMSHFDILDDLEKRMGVIYSTYSAKDRFLVPMDVYIMYTNLVDQNIQVHESLICTHTSIPNYGRPIFQVREPDKKHNIHPPISLKRLNENGIFIFGQHEK